MKFSQIKKICKDAKECVIYNEGRMQWIGTGEAALEGGVLTLDAHTTALLQPAGQEDLQ